MRSICLIIFIISVAVHAQVNFDQGEIDPGHFNRAWLEHLVKIKVDSVRKAHGLSGLSNDSISYLAAFDQAKYVTGLKNLTHFQDKSKKKSPQNRVEFYGAKEYRTGENLIRVYLLSPTTSTSKKKKKGVIIHSYEQAAVEIVTGWVNSPEHYKNMLIPYYRITGLAVFFNPDSKELNAAQVFAGVPSYFIPNNAASLFPYEGSFNPALYADQPEAKTEIHHRHAWDIKMNPKMGDLTAWKNYEPDLEYSGLAVSNRTIIFNGGKYRSAEKFLKRRRDGMMAEVVPFSRYNCSTNEYSLPGRRNGECIYNGIALKPIYRKELLNTNILGRVPKKKPRKLTLALGKIPVNTGEPNEINVLILKRKNIVGMVQFHHLRDTLFQYTTTLPYLPTPPVNLCQCYTPSAPLKNYTIFLFYDINQTIPNSTEIEKLNEFLSIPGLKMEKIQIQAFASIEGNMGINDKLYRERARIIHDSLRAFLPAYCPVTESVGENWKKFSEQIRNEKYAFLQKMDTSSIRQIMNDSAYTSMKAILDAQRYSQVYVEYRQIIPPNQAIAFAVKEYLSLYSRYKTRWEKSGAGLQLTSEEKQHMQQILDYLMQATLEKKAGFELLDSLPFLLEKKTDKFQPDPLDELYARKLAFDLNYRPEIIDDAYLHSAYSVFRKLKNHLPLFDFNYQAWLINHFDESSSVIDLKGLEDVISKVSPFLDSTRLNQLKLFYHFAKARDVAGKGVDKYSEASSSLRFIHDFFMKNGCSADYRIALAKFFLTFQKYEMANDILAPVIKKENRDKEAYMLWLKIYYARTGIEDLAFSDYQPLFEAAEWLPPSDFCSLFETDDRINFQILNYAPLRNVYCRKKALLN